MISGDGISHVQEDMSILDVLDWSQTSSDLLEERWVVDISR
jgi:hypothetical protein